MVTGSFILRKSSGAHYYILNIYRYHLHALNVLIYVHISMIVSKFIKLSDQHYNQVLEHFLYHMPGYNYSLFSPPALGSQYLTFFLYIFFF